MPFDHYMTPAAHAAILAANREHRARLAALRAQRPLREFLERQGQPVRDVPAVRVPTLLRVL